MRAIDCYTIPFYQITLPPAGSKPHRPKASQASLSTGEHTHAQVLFVMPKQGFGFKGNLSEFQLFPLFYPSMSLSV